MSTESSSASFASSPPHTYFTPAEHPIRVSEKTLEAWYYAWKRGGIEALVPKTRRDRGHSKLPPRIQAAIVGAKRDYPKRLLNTLKRLLEMQGVVAQGELSRSSLHRLLQHHELSRMAGSSKKCPQNNVYVMT